MAEGAGLDRLQAEWERMAADDAMWAVLSDRRHKHGRWTAEEFFRTGTDFIDGVLERGTRLGHPQGRRDALDFGCGVGRLTRALAAHFDHAVGVDISERMLAAGREHHAGVANLELRLNRRGDLGDFDDATFDMVNSWIVLQHMPSRALIERYLRELIRVLRPGGLLHVGVPDRIPTAVRLLSRRRPYVVLRRLGVPEEVLYRRLGLHSMHMTAFPVIEVCRVLESAGARLLTVHVDPQEGPAYYVTR